MLRSCRASICVNEVVISPTWNRGYAHAAGLGPSRYLERTQMSTPRTVRLSPNDNVVVAVDPIPEGASAAGVTARGARDARPQDGDRADRARASRCASTTRSSALPRQPIAPGDWVHTQNVEMHDFARDYQLRRRREERRGAAARTARDLRGLCAAGRQDRHAQLHRHPHLGELLGLGGALHRARGGALRRARRSSRDRRRGGVRARHRLRARRLWRGLRRAAPHPVGLRDARQSRRAR